MDVTGVSSATSSYQAQFSTGFRQTMQDFRALGSALQSGDLSSAQSAFATLQKDIQNSPRLQQLVGDTSTQAGKDFQALQSALQSGDLSSAQKAFASLQQDFQSMRQVSGAQVHGHRHHHPHHSPSSTSVSDSATSSGTATGANATGANMPGLLA
jgi:hypothetical protein